MTKKTKRQIIIPIILSLLLIFALFQKPYPPPEPPPPNSIELGSGQFIPSLVKVRVGTLVTWSNRSGVTRDLFALDNRFAPTALYPGQSFSYRFAEQGRYYFYHQEGKSYRSLGTVVVSND